MRVGWIVAGCAPGVLTIDSRTWFQSITGCPDSRAVLAIGASAVPCTRPGPSEGHACSKSHAARHAPIARSSPVASESMPSFRAVERACLHHERFLSSCGPTGDAEVAILPRGIRGWGYANALEAMGDAFADFGSGCNPGAYQ